MFCHKERNIESENQDNTCYSYCEGEIDTAMKRVTQSNTNGIKSKERKTIVQRTILLLSLKITIQNMSWNDRIRKVSEP